MSKALALDNAKQLVQKAESDFVKLAKIHKAVTFEAEASYASHILMNNSFLVECAIGDPNSLHQAVVNVAAIGLTLNPIKKLAYLLPRKGKVTLDISYEGLKQLATDVGVIKWATAENVYEHDTFRYKGIDQRPVHEFDPFSDRGSYKGSYCLTKLTDDSFMCVVMNKDEVYKIRDRSESYKKSSGPWVSDPEEMQKKTVIRRASKSWPKPTSKELSDRLDKAVSISDEAEDVNFEVLPKANSEEVTKIISNISGALEFLGKTNEEYLKYCETRYKRDLSSFEDMTENELKGALTFLNQMVDKKMVKDEKPVEKKIPNMAPGANND